MSLLPAILQQYRRSGGAHPSFQILPNFEPMGAAPVSPGFSRIVVLVGFDPMDNAALRFDMNGTSPALRFRRNIFGAYGLLASTFRKYTLSNPSSIRRPVS